jgi:hypothetical protein
MAASPNEVPIVREPTSLTFYDGSTLVMNGGTMVPSTGTQAAAITDVPVAGLADAALNAIAINSMLAALRGTGIIAT